VINKDKLITILKRFTWSGLMPDQWITSLAEYLIKHELDIINLDIEINQTESEE